MWWWEVKACVWEWTHLSLDAVRRRGKCGVCTFLHSDPARPSSTSTISLAPTTSLVPSLCTDVRASGLAPYNPFLPYQSLSPLFVYSAKSAEAPAPESRKKRHRTRYQLDVGAYGIPKRSRGPCVAGRDGLGRFDGRAETHSEELSRAVQVGEDAYFVWENAMGVVDGVGGWSRHR